MDENIEQEEMMPEAPKERPVALSVICVLSLINAAYNVFANFVISAFYNTYKTMLSDDNNEVVALMAKMLGDSWDEMVNSYTAMLSVNRSYYIINTLVYIASLVGVSMMWRLKKIGFHVYAIAQILLLILSTIFIYNRIGGSPIFDVLMAAIFILWYFRFYKTVMK